MKLYCAFVLSICLPFSLFASFLPSSPPLPLSFSLSLSLLTSLFHPLFNIYREWLTFPFSSPRFSLLFLPSPSFSFLIPLTLSLAPRFSFFLPYSFLLSFYASSLFCLFLSLDFLFQSNFLFVPSLFAFSPLYIITMKRKADDVKNIKKEWEKEEAPFSAHFICAGWGATLAATTVQPIENLIYRYKVTDVSYLDAFRRIAKDPRGILRIFDGCFASSVRSAAYFSCFLTLYEAGKRGSLLKYFSGATPGICTPYPLNFLLPPNTTFPGCVFAPILDLTIHTVPKHPTLHPPPEVLISLQSTIPLIVPIPSPVHLVTFPFVEIPEPPPDSDPSSPSPSPSSPPSPSDTPSDTPSDSPFPSSSPSSLSPSDSFTPSEGSQPLSPSTISPPASTPDPQPSSPSPISVPPSVLLKRDSPDY